MKYKNANDFKFIHTCAQRESKVVRRNKRFKLRVQLRRMSYISCNEKCKIMSKKAKSRLFVSNFDIFS